MRFMSVRYPSLPPPARRPVCAGRRIGRRGVRLRQRKGGLFDFVEEFFRRLEGRDVVCRHLDRRVFRNVAGDLLGAVLAVESAEAAQVDVLAADQSLTHLFHKCLYDSRCGRLFDPRLLGDLLYNFCFCHSRIVLIEPCFVVASAG